MNWALLASLVVVGGLVITALLLVAVLTQTLRPTTISMTNHLEVVSFNSAPNQIMVQFARTLQEQWFEKIPNRRYINVSPRVVGQEARSQVKCSKRASQCRPKAAPSLFLMH